MFLSVRCARTQSACGPFEPDAEWQQNHLGLLSCYIRACGHTESSLCKNLGQRRNQESSRTGVKSRHEVERIHTAGNWITVARVYKVFLVRIVVICVFQPAAPVATQLSNLSLPLYVFSFSPHAPQFFFLRVSLFS